MSNWGEECPRSLARCGAHFLQHMFWSLCGNLFLEQLVGNKGHLLLVEGMSDLLHLGSLIFKVWTNIYTFMEEDYQLPGSLGSFFATHVSFPWFVEKREIHIRFHESEFLQTFPTGQNGFPFQRNLFFSYKTSWGVALLWEH